MNSNKQMSKLMKEYYVESYFDTNFGDKILLSMTISLMDILSRSESSSSVSKDSIFTNFLMSEANKSSNK